MAKDSAKALRIKIQAKQPREQFLALTALECVMKNCGLDYAELIVAKGVLETCMELASNRLTNVIVREKVLCLIREWAENIKIREFRGVYRDLMSYGVQFPSTSSTSTQQQQQQHANVQQHGNYNEPIHRHSMGIPSRSQTVPARQVLKYDATMSEEDRIAIQLALQEEEADGGPIVYSDGVFGSKEELPGGGHPSSKSFKRYVQEKTGEKYKLDAIGRKPQSTMPVEGHFVQRERISLTEPREHPDKIRERERAKKFENKNIDRAEQILSVFQETLLDDDSNNLEVCGILAEQAKEISSVLVAMLTESSYENMDETKMSRIIELNEKLLRSIAKYERMENSTAAAVSAKSDRHQQHDLLGISSDDLFRPSIRKNDSSNPFATTMAPTMESYNTKTSRYGPSTTQISTINKSDDAFDAIFGKSSFSVSPDNAQGHTAPLSLREQFMMKQQKQQQPQQLQLQSPSTSETSSASFFTPLSESHQNGPPQQNFSPPSGSSRSLNGSQTALGSEAKREKEREIALHDPFASLALNAGLTPKKSSVTSPYQSASREIGSPEKKNSTLTRSPTNPFQDDDALKFPKI